MTGSTKPYCDKFNEMSARPQAKAMVAVAVAKATVVVATGDIRLVIVDAGHHTEERQIRGTRLFLDACLLTGAKDVSGRKQRTSRGCIFPT